MVAIIFYGQTLKQRINMVLSFDINFSVYLILMYY